MKLYDAIMEALEEYNKVILEDETGTGIRVIVRDKTGRIHSTEVIPNSKINNSGDPESVVAEVIERRQKDVEDLKKQSVKTPNNGQ